VKYLLLAAFIGSSVAPGPVTFRHENVLGTSLELKVVSPSAAEAELGEAAVLAEIDRLSAILSGYHASSEFSRWERTRGVAVPVSAELAEVLSLWDRWQTESGGALNPATEAAAPLWRQAAISAQVPAGPSLAQAAAAMRGPHWTLAPCHNAAGVQCATRLTTAPLRLNSFTKSWILARAAQAAMRTGAVQGLMLNMGGDIVTLGAMEQSIALADPRNDAENAAPLGTLRARDLAVATSGDYRRGFDIAGQHYSHILDPRTARPASGVISATVVSRDAVEAGALATAFSILTPGESATLAARHPRAEYLLLAANGQRYSSAGWTVLFAQAGATASGAAAADVQVSLELARIDAGRYRRPFVAVWIEDKDKFPVRTIALWFDRPRWLPDLKAWSRADRLRSMAEGTDLAATVASATRPAGKYTIKWDGKDQAGKPVKPGKYTVYLEAAREHGTYQLLRQEIDLTSPQAFSLSGGTEIAAASIEVKKLR